MRPHYFDYAATTPVDPLVAEKMAQCLTTDGNFGNPASRSHLFGWQAEEAVEEARNEVADLIGADNREIVWTSGATEANNLAIKGVAENFAPAECHIITCATEHKAVLDCIQHLQGRGYDISVLTPDDRGVLSVEKLEQAIRPHTRLISLMAVNNETGVINPIPAIGKRCQQLGIFFHVDAAQAIGKLAVDVDQWQVTLMSLSAHKFYGPKGIGALYVRRRSPLTLQAQIQGGGHERGMRSGTLPTHQIVGMGVAAQLVQNNLSAEIERIAHQQQSLWQGLVKLGGVTINGEHTERVPNLMNLCFAGVNAEALMMAAPQLAMSSGSACTSATMSPSHVLKAMGLSDEDSYHSLRISLGRFTDDDDIAAAVECLSTGVNTLRSTPLKRQG